MKKIKNLIFLIVLWFFAFVNIGSIFANNDRIYNWGTLPEVEVTAKSGKGIIPTKIPLSQPARPSDEEIKASMSKLQEKINNKPEKKEKTIENSNECKGIKLNTDFPFIWRCIGISGGEAGVNQTNAFAFMIKGIMKFIITIIMIMSVLMIVVAGVMMTTGGVEKSNYSKGIEMIKNVAWALALLGASGVILKLINPNFFT